MTGIPIKEANGAGAPASATGLRRHSRATLTQDLLAELRQAIVMGQIPPGAPLRLEELASQFGVSVSPVREVLRQLEVIGLAEHLPYRGHRVAPLSADEMDETYEIRAALETLAVVRAATRFTEDDAALSQAAIDAIDQAYDDHDDMAVIHGNTAFHLSIARASRSAGLVRLIGAACETSERYSAALLQAHRIEQTSQVEHEGHRAILDACVAHDVEAAKAVLEQHLVVFGELFSSMWRQIS
jgi:DNA-binding GntR family transcriptional regulator